MIFVLGVKLSKWSKTRPRAEVDELSARYLATLAMLTTHTTRLVACELLKAAESRGNAMGLDQQDDEQPSATLSVLSLGWMQVRSLNKLWCDLLPNSPSGEHYAPDIR